MLKVLFSLVTLDCTNTAKFRHPSAGSLPYPCQPSVRHIHRFCKPLFLHWSIDFVRHADNILVETLRNIAPPAQPICTPWPSKTSISLAHDHHLMNGWICLASTCFGTAVKLFHVLLMSEPWRCRFRERLYLSRNYLTFFVLVLMRKVMKVPIDFWIFVQLHPSYHQGIQEKFFTLLYRNNHFLPEAGILPYCNCTVRFIGADASYYTWSCQSISNLIIQSCSCYCHWGEAFRYNGWHPNEKAQTCP